MTGQKPAAWHKTHSGPVNFPERSQTASESPPDLLENVALFEPVAQPHRRVFRE